MGTLRGKFMTFLPSPLASVVFLLSFIAYLVAGLPLFGNPDTPWHLAAGDLIRAGGIPDHDTWSYTAGSAPWYNLSWAWDALISGVMQCFGPYGLYLFTAAAASAVLAVLGHTLKARALVSDFYIGLTLLLVWYVLLSYLYPQPWMVTLLMTAIFHHLLHKSRDENNYRSLLWLPPLMIIWVNMHGGFIVGHALIFIYAIEAQQTRQYAWLKRLVIAFIVTDIVCIFNPYGLYIIAGFFRTMDSVITQYLADWHPITIGNEVNLTLLLLLFICCSNIRDPRIPVADKILTLAWLIYALHSRRNFIIFAIVAAPYFAYSMQEFARYTQGAKHKADRWRLEDSPAHRVKAFIAAAAIIAVIVLTPLKTWLVSPEKVDDDPFKLRPALAALQPITGRVRFINDYNIGGYLIYASGTKWPVFADGRAGTAYSEEVLQDSIDFANLNPGYEALFDKYKADGVIVLNMHRFAQMMQLSPHRQWKEIYKGESVSAYRRVR